MADRLFLRPFQAADAQMFGRNVMCDPEFPAAAGLSDKADLPSAGEYVLQRAGYAERPHFYDFAVVRKEDNEVIGEINAAFIPPDTADIGYVIGRNYRGFGYGTEAVNQLIELLARDGVTCIYGACRMDNNASAKVMRACGMKETENVPVRVRQRESEEGLRWFVKSV